MSVSMVTFMQWVSSFSMKNSAAGERTPSQEQTYHRTWRYMLAERRVNSVSLLYARKEDVNVGYGGVTVSTENKHSEDEWKQSSMNISNSMFFPFTHSQHSTYTWPLTFSVIKQVFFVLKRKKRKQKPWERREKRKVLMRQKIFKNTNEAEGIEELRQKG